MELKPHWLSQFGCLMQVEVAAGVEEVGMVMMMMRVVQSSLLPLLQLIVVRLRTSEAVLWQ